MLKRTIFVRGWLLIAMLFCVVILFTACSNDGNAKYLAEGPIDIDIEASQEFLFDEEVVDLDIISLEESPASFLGGTTKVVFRDDEIFVFDRYKNQLVIFDKHGKYINAITTVSEGPVQIGAIYDFDINQFTGNIDLLSPDGRLVEFDRATGEYRNKIDITGSDQARSYHGFINVSPDVVVFYSYGDDHFLHGFSLSKKKLLWEAIPNGGFKYFYFLADIPDFWKDGDRYLFYEHISGDVVEITTYGARAINEVDFGRNQFDLESADASVHQSPANILKYLEDKSFFYPFANFFRVEENDYFVSGYYKNRLWWMLKRENGSSCRMKIPKQGGLRILDTYSDGYFHGLIFRPNEIEEGFPEKLKVPVEGLIQDNDGKEINPVLFRFKLRGC